MTEHPFTCAQLVADIREAHPARAAITLCFGGCIIGVTANARGLIGELTDYFGPFVVDSMSDDDPVIGITVHEADPPAFDAAFTVKRPDPGKTKIKEEFLELPDGRIVRKRLTGMVFLFGEGRHAAVGPCRDNLNQVVNFINNRYIEWALCRGALLGHAAGILFNGRGLGLAGFSGAGKSTLALQLMNHGAVFVSNDRLMIRKSENGLTMNGVAKLPRINPGTALNNPSLAGIMSEADRRRFSAMPEADLWSVEHKYDAPIDACFGDGRFVLEGPMDGLAILNWRRNAGPPTARQVDLRQRPDLLPAFMKSTGLFFLPSDGCAMPDPTEGVYADYLSACTVWEISGGIDFEAAAQELLAWLSR